MVLLNFFFPFFPLYMASDGQADPVHVFRTNSTTQKAFPEKSHSGQLKKAVSDGQWQMPWLRCKSKADMEQYLNCRQGGN